MNVPKKEIANPDHNQDHHDRDLGSEDIHLLHRILLEVLEVVVKVNKPAVIAKLSPFFVDFYRLRHDFITIFFPGSSRRRRKRSYSSGSSRSRSRSRSRSLSVSSASSDSVRRELRRHKAAKAAAEKLNKQNNKSNEPNDNIVNTESNRIDQPQNNSTSIKNRANDEVSFLTSGKLLEDTNTVNGIVVR